MARRPHPYGTVGRAALPDVEELRKRLTTRLQYAHFKLTNDRIAHSLSELENLYLRPFRAQADARAAARRADPRRQRWRDEAIRADEARERGEAPPPAQEQPHVRMKPSAVKLGKRKAVDQDSPPIPRRAPAPPVERKAPNFIMRFQGLPSTLDMNAVVRELADRKPTPAPHPVDEDDEDVPMLPEPNVGDGRRRAETRTSSSSSYLEPDAWAGASPLNGVVQPDPVRLQSLRRTTSEALSPQETHSIPRQGSSTSLLTNGSAASLLLNSSYAPPPPASSSSSSAPLAPPVDLAPSLYAGPAAAVPSPYSARSNAAFSNTTLAPASSTSALRPHIPPAHDPPAQRAYTYAVHSSPSAPFAPLSLSSTASSQPTPHTSQSSARSARSGTSATSTGLALGSQASFSALPPVPPLPFEGLADAGGGGGGGGWGSQVPPPTSNGVGGGASQGLSQASWVGRLSGGSTTGARPVGVGSSPEAWRGTTGTKSVQYGVPNEVVRAAAAAMALYSDEDDDEAVDGEDGDEEEGEEGEDGRPPLRVDGAEGSRPPSPSGSDDEAADEDDPPRFPPMSQDTLIDSQGSSAAGAGGETQGTQETQETQVSDGGTQEHVLGT